MRSVTLRTPSLTRAEAMQAAWQPRCTDFLDKKRNEERREERPSKPQFFAPFA
jgi:hypothetical protein